MELNSLIVRMVIFCQDTVDVRGLVAATAGHIKVHERRRDEVEGGDNNLQC